MNRFSLTLLAFSTIATTGCLEIPLAILAIGAIENAGSSYNDTGYVDTGFVDTGSFGFVGDPEVSGRMSGEMPHNGQFRRDLTGGSVWSSSDSVELEVHALGDSWAMVRGGFDTTGIEDGVPTLLGASQHWFIGCSGPQEYDMAFDGPADEVEVERNTVEIDGEIMIELTVTLDFGDAGVVDTVVVYPQPDPDEDY